MTLTKRISARRGTLATLLAGLTMLFPAWGIAQGQAKEHARTTCSAADYRNDPRLGPEHLPDAGPLATVLKGWHRLDEMTPHAYLHAYYDAAAKTWRYPPLGGYLLTPDGMAISNQVTLAPGEVIDRFGSEYGGYLSPVGTPYADRGIPPQSLDNTTTPETCNYSRYKVLQPIPVQSGPIAPALGQPGFGLQYVLDATIFPGNPAGLNVMYLVANGYLARVTG
ncbi:MAG TPA: TNT domain-containing protein [Solirubrobacteraceae bacterium]